MSAFCELGRALQLVIETETFFRMLLEQVMKLHASKALSLDKAVPTHVEDD